MSEPSKHSRLIRLLMGATMVVVVWCDIFPRLLHWPPIARHVSLMEERGVDPSAMYYTELERLPLRPAWVDDLLVLWP
jgi:hypothetical protein